MRVIRDFETAEDGTTRSSFHPCEKPNDVSHLSNLNNLDNPTEYTPFLPCHYFDYIGGTSTGALIAILLSVFRMTVEDCLKEVVLATRLHDQPVITKRFMFRSYTPYDDWKRERAQSSVNLYLRNPNEGMRVLLLKVALAGTAAPFYFGHYQTFLSTSQAEAATRVATRNGTNLSRAATGWMRRENHLPEGKSAYKFEDAGFSTANNPCLELKREIQYHHGENTPVLVSIGTARPKEEFVGESAAALIKRGLHQLGNPEEVHETLESDRYNGNYSYYRLNDEDGIRIEMDEWKPKKVGTETIARMRTEFQRWLQKDGVEDKFRECAEHLVRLRRVRMTTPRWERFALGQYFVCQVRNCPKDRDNQWLDRADFENHLRREHRVEDYEGKLDEALNTCRRLWRYRQRAASS
ncbi:hypothetical protein F4823DRAFT_583249 [Ustulina deusta]|nr:hypothetical protein F4823DRAFT_583249 [Ustulina deusta]